MKKGQEKKMTRRDFVTCSPCCIWASMKNGAPHSRLSSFPFHGPSVSIPSPPISTTGWGGVRSKGAAAENKIPPVATHPAGVLINNVLRLNPERRDYLPIFDRRGKEVTVGDISCLSCHSFYMWDHRLRKQGPMENIDGDATTSFLRTSPQNLVCIDCHGEEAIWRYTYFHSIQKRKLLMRNQVVKPIANGTHVVNKSPHPAPHSDTQPPEGQFNTNTRK